MFGWYAQANMPMLTVMVFLPAAFAFVFRAVGMYHTEDPLKPRTSVQAAAIAALCFIPVVAAEPQLLFALIVVFLMFLLFVRRKRAMLLLIPVPAAFAVAPTLVNAVRYADLGMWRQLFGDITVPTSSANGSPASLSLLEAAQRALGWRMGSTDYADLAVTVLFGVITLLALASLVLPFALRTSRLMWVVIVCGGALALVSSRVAITVDADGVVAGSAQPGIAMMILGFLACVCLVAGGAVKRFQPLHASGSDPASKKDRLHVLIVSGRVVLALILVCCIGIQCMYGIERHKDAGLGVSENGLPMVTTDYLEAGADHRVLAVSAETRNIVNYAVMRTSRGDLIDSSPAQRVEVAFGRSDDANKAIAKDCAQLLSNADSDAVADLSELGFGGIYVVRSGEDKAQKEITDQLSSNISASDGTQNVVSTDAGTYYRLTIQDTAKQHIDRKGYRQAESSVWRQAWLWCMGIVLAAYCLVALPRMRRHGQEEA